MKSAIVPTQRLQRHAKRPISVPVLGRIPDVSAGIPSTGTISRGDVEDEEWPTNTLAADEFEPAEDFESANGEASRTRRRRRSTGDSTRPKDDGKLRWPLSNFILVGIAVLLVVLFIVLTMRRAAEPEPLPGEWPQNLDHIADDTRAHEHNGPVNPNAPSGTEQTTAQFGGTTQSELSTGQPVEPAYESPANLSVSPLVGDPSASSDPPGVARLTGTIGAVEFEARQTPQPPTTH